MDYTNLLKDNSGKVSKVGIVGATKGYSPGSDPKSSTYGTAGYLFPSSSGVS